MTLTQLEYFAETVRSGNFTKAAGKLFVSQPTLSRAIQNLEKELNTILIDRDAKDFQLTRDGLIFFSYAEDMLTDFREKTREMMDKLENADGKLRLGITPTTGAIYFFSAIYRFRELYPVVDLEIEEVTTRQGMEMVLSGQLDMSVVIDPVEDSQLIKLPVVNSEAVLLVPKGHPLGKRRSVSFAEIQNEPMLMVSKEYMYHDVVAEKFREAGIEPHFAFESNQWEFIFEMVANGQGISILPKPLVDKFNNARVHQAHLEKPDFPWTLSLIRRKDKYLSTPCRCFWNMCQHEKF
ncbi:MAG: LysR family transcriptional regulator [Clostridiales bacterium]|nr:LysR family transcriptional regulator [Candidatus Cacconaster stercorequi]